MERPVRYTPVYRLVAAGAIALCLAMSGASAAQVAPTPQQIAQRARLATVQIRSLDANGRVNGTGSGFFVSADGTIVTNFHVIKDAASLEVERDSGEIFDNVYYVASDPRRDTAILKIPVGDASVLPLGSDDPVETGSHIFVMGNPLGQTATFSDGLVSAQRTTNGVQLLQVTAPISPGSSGGPAMNDQGQVIGIATMFLEGGQNLNFLVPVHYVRPMISMGDQPRQFTASLLPRTGGGLADIDVPASGDGGGTAGSTWREVLESLTSQLKSTDSGMRERHYSPSHEPVFGVLDTSRDEVPRFALRKGRSYAFVAVCDDDCEDIDLAVYDLDGKEAKIDDDESDLAVVTYDPVASGDYIVRVHMYSCTAEPCGYGLKVYVKD